MHFIFIAFLDGSKLDLFALLTVPIGNFNAMGEASELVENYKYTFVIKVRSICQEHFSTAGENNTTSIPSCEKDEDGNISFFYIWFEFVGIK